MKKIICMILSVALCGTFVLSGCGKQDKNGGDGTADKKENEKEIVVATNSETGGLDPAGMIALTYLAYSVSALDELLTYNEAGEIEYRAAESYEVNDDSTVWTFHLRKDAGWSDGTPVTADDFINTMVRSLDPKSGNGYANYLYPIKNAEAIYNGEADADSLGVKAVDDNTLEFTLEKPCVYFLDLLRLPVYTPSCVKYADEVGSGWDKDPKTSVANGPFYLDEYVPEQYFVLKKNEKYWNADKVKLDKITYRFFDDQQSMASAYETGEVDVAPALLSSVMELYEGKDDLVITDTIATRYIYPNLNVKPLDDVRVRKAINLGINREELCSMVGADTEPTVNFIAKYMKDKQSGGYFVDGAEPPFEENLEEAKKLLAEAGYPDGKGFPKLTYSYPSLEMDSDTAQVLQEQLKKNLNIDIELNAQELQVNYTERKAGNFDLCRMNWTADFADPYTYLSMLLSNGTYNCSGIRDEKYDALVEQSDTEKDPVKRAELMHQAEQLAVGEEFYIIPLYSMKSCNLIRPEIKGITQIPATGALEYRYAELEE
ncbi:peptide ABC transporter substrate-binding protein [Faecalicatena orotica]|uniref:Oligopeptide transport system substrate-binding protein n=1 Tax=Faecalicatena orotica TaxID=1544 RepID=A0A2Y9BLZ1_9FIRM|nr:peptide ABC transporter substrate-binding protein [Faecalicatena orotica]PWJ28374.1 oligopeptide transport system substrate-binding protein [Faecalicatena orotica]SSA56830.1 oligopeptide transport system substrate-binding protein [Faecalicatena orotica]